MFEFLVAVALIGQVPDHYVEVPRPAVVVPQPPRVTVEEQPPLVIQRPPKVRLTPQPDKVYEQEPALVPVYRLPEPRSYEVLPEFDLFRLNLFPLRERRIEVLEKVKVRERYKFRGFFGR